MANNKSQVITQNVHVKTKDERQQQPESLVVSVPLSSATVPGIQLPTTISTNSSSNNNSTISAIVSNQAPSTATPAIAVSVPPQGSLYQHLTNSQTTNQRASPLIQQGLGRASPITPTPSPLVNDGHVGSNHTSVLQNMNAGSVISSAGFHVTNAEPNTPGMLKVTYEKQVPARIQAIQQEETTRRSR
jgi:protein AF-17/10